MERETDVLSSDLPANKILFKHFLIVNPKACNQYNSVVVVVVVVAIFRGVKKCIQNMLDNCELFVPSKMTLEGSCFILTSTMRLPGTSMVRKTISVYFVENVVKPKGKRFWALLPRSHVQGRV